MHFGRKSNFNLESELKRFKDSSYEEVGSIETHGCNLQKVK